MKKFKTLKGKNKRKILVFLAAVTIFLVVTHLCFPSIKSIFLTKIAFAEDGGGSDGGGSDGGSSGGGSDGGSSGGGSDGGSGGGGSDGGSSGGGSDGGSGGGGGTDSGGNGGGGDYYGGSVPSLPTGLSASCPVPGTSAILSWNVVPGATYYWLRVDNITNGWSGTCDWAYPGDICTSVSGNSYSFSSTPSANYWWWVHACNANGCSDATGAGFTCTAPSCTPSCGGCSVSCGGGTQTCTRADCSTYSQSCNTQYCPINVDIKANGSDSPITLFYKNDVTLSWISQDAAFCEASGDWSGSKSTVGTQTIQLNTVKTYTFTITCRNASGSQTASDLVRVVASPTLPVVVTKPAIVTY